MKKKIAIMGAVLMMAALMMSSFTVSAASADDFDFSGTDPAGDVTDANVDLVSAEVTSDGTNVIFKLTVSGQIVSNNDDYDYSFGILDSSMSNGLSITFYNESAEYVGNSGTSSVPYSVSGSTLEVQVPLAAFSSFETPFSMVGASAENSETNTKDDITMSANYGGGDDGTGDGSGDGGSGDDGAGDGGNSGLPGFPQPIVTHTDPATEKPTDTSISVSVSYVNVVMKNKTNEMEIDITIRGTTNGADHVAIGWSTYYKNGTHKWEGSWIPGPFEVEANTDMPFGMGHVYEYYFKATSENWKTWEFRMHTTMPKSSYEGNDENATDFNEVDHMRVWARAYSDSSGNSWNQGYYDLTMSVSSDGNTISGGTDNSGSDSGGGSSGIPGFEAVLAVSAISLAVAAYSIRRRH